MRDPGLSGCHGAPSRPPQVARSTSSFEIDSHSSSGGGGNEEAAANLKGPEEEFLSRRPQPPRSDFLVYLLRLKYLWMRWLDNLFCSVCGCSRALHALISSKQLQQQLRSVPFRLGGGVVLLVLVLSRLWRMRELRRQASGVSTGGGLQTVRLGLEGAGKGPKTIPSLFSRLLSVGGIWGGGKTAAAAAASEEPFSRVLELVGGNAVEEVHFGPGRRLLLTLRDNRQVRSSLIPGAETAFFHAVSCRVPRFKAVRGSWIPAAISFAAPLLLMGIWFRLLRGLLEPLQQQNRSNGSERDAADFPPPTRFKDVVSRKKEELQEIVWLLNGQQDKYSSMGARLPRGVLLVGPAGTGKSLLARAVAGEIRAVFLSTAASEFSDIFVGQGARRVREIFRTAREKAPCVLFIDELDALGSRGGSHGLPAGAAAANQEYVQTINQLLAEIDGVMGAAAGVVVVAATNRLEAIDPALLRSGRFDRIIHLNLPDEEERLHILELHAKLKKLRLSSTAQIHLKHIAAAGEGLSGADLENLLNESVFRAVRRNKTFVDEEALNEALLTLLQRTHTTPHHNSNIFNLS
ncbi:OSJNBa0016O02.1 protein, related [Eimeria praecox]|uniref:OSJNBa0016O02.1 protein, related n=1 Tax=Eimeria praecox TaxID=51316 RepID=U6G5H4_9EIME|nr:OSJNBa0016O02.1 protein, related [Eimeria praecox]